MTKLFPCLLPMVLIVTALQAEETWCLYRSEPWTPGARVHVATFDAYLDRPTLEPVSYNLQNCRLTAELLRLRRGSAIRYWCEYGRFVAK